MQRFVNYFDYLEEEIKLKKLQRIADVLCFLIVRKKLSIPEAEEKIQEARREAQEIVPDQMETFDLIYTNRFRRLIDQYLKRPPSPK
ncbi:MAG: hypothetical protein A2145_02380 [candidate division Zixibacteria bacterium RBG_16_40_9]|nr:MAG: hypothetical protein A2145_02380 [candidate division Zixibacteria bacterium RBG_16_40_9]